ncbi:aldo/keto reductase [Streptomyces sp. PSRA5]
MRFRTLGRRRDATPGPRVSTLCLGTMPFGTRVDEATCFAILDRFVGRGGTFIDTANCYSFWEKGAHGGDSEEVIGRWMAARGNREEIVLATKAGARPAGPGVWPANAEGLSAEALRAGVEGSLRRLAPTGSTSSSDTSRTARPRRPTPSRGSARSSPTAPSASWAPATR